MQSITENGDISIQISGNNFVGILIDGSFFYVFEFIFFRPVFNIADSSTRLTE